MKAPQMNIGTRAAILLACATILPGCAQIEPAVPLAEEGKEYNAELRACTKNNATCPGYVACRARVEAAHGRTYNGRCAVTP
jgi:hypothetical protein